MMDRLRRYVPGAIADELASGGVLEDGEREVSVLFVDVRGYTSYAEHRGASEIFASVNRYTETVSEVVRRRGGSVVEFNGDGMMAVFGAPRALERKESLPPLPPLGARAHSSLTAGLFPSQAALPPSTALPESMARLRLEAVVDGVFGELGVG